MSTEIIRVVEQARMEFSLTLPVHSNFVIDNLSSETLYISRVPDRVVKKAGTIIPGLTTFFSGIIVDTVDLLYYASMQPRVKFRVRGSLDESPFARLYLYTDQGAILTDDQGNPLIEA